MKIAAAIVVSLYAIFCASAFVSENWTDWKEARKRKGAK